MEKNLANLAQKALYFGMGIASYAADKASAVARSAPGHFTQLRQRAQQITDELVKRGEMSAEEAKGVMDELMQKAPQQVKEREESEIPPASGPRRIQIDDMGEIDEQQESSAIQLTDSARLRQEIEALEAELESLNQPDP